MCIVFLVISLGILITLCMKGIPIFLSAFAASVFLAITAGLNTVDSMVLTYSTELAGFFGKFDADGYMDYKIW